MYTFTAAQQMLCPSSLSFQPLISHALQLQHSNQLCSSLSNLALYGHRPAPKFCTLKSQSLPSCPLPSFLSSLSLQGVVDSRITLGFGQVVRSIPGGLCVQFRASVNSKGNPKNGRNEDDEVYVKSFTGNKGERERLFGDREVRDGPQKKVRNSEERGERSSSYHKVPTSSSGERPGFKGERKGRGQDLEREMGFAREVGKPTQNVGNGRKISRETFGIDRREGREDFSNEEEAKPGPSQRNSTRKNDEARSGREKKGKDEFKGGDTGSFLQRERGRSEGSERPGIKLGGRDRDGDSRVNGASERFGERRRGAGQSDMGEGENVSNEGFSRQERGDQEKEDPGLERKRRKEPALAEQVHFTTPMRKDPHIAILGGGMSGLLCALELEERGIRSTVFDTGKHGLGGRMGTRHVELREGLSLVFDHAAQYFTVSDPRFRTIVDQWIKEGAVKEWTGVVGTLQPGGQFVELPAVPRYIGTHGMRTLADHIVSRSRLIEVRRPVWISRMDPRGDRWQLSENGTPHGSFDAVVIAHNGKCANRLLRPSGVPLVYKQMKRLELSSIWALMAAFQEPLPSPVGVKADRPLDGAFVEGVKAVSWMANNASKLSLSEEKELHCWTLFSTAAYGKKNKVPQESIPVVKAERVKREMLQGAETALGLSEGSMPAPFYTRVQLWGAALPTNTPDVPCIFDAHGRVGICGDWLLGSSLEAAALSGIALGQHIADYRDRGELNPDEFSIGLQKGFEVVEGQDIGQFPGTPGQQQLVTSELLAATH